MIKKALLLSLVIQSAPCLAAEASPAASDAEAKVAAAAPAIVLCTDADENPEGESSRAYLIRPSSKDLLEIALQFKSPSKKTVYRGWTVHANGHVYSFVDNQKELAHALHENALKELNEANGGLSQSEALYTRTETAFLKQPGLTLAYGRDDKAKVAWAVAMHALKHNAFVLDELKKHLETIFGTKA